jgi:hypothetical protein
MWVSSTESGVLRGACEERRTLFGSCGPPVDVVKTRLSGFDQTVQAVGCLLLLVAA